MLRRILKIVGVVIVVAAVALGVYSYRLYSQIQGIVNYRLHRIHNIHDPKIQYPSLNGTKRINILLLGSDTDSKGIPKLSQTMIVVTIDPVHRTVGMLSIPRDFWVPIPNVYGYHKIDAAMSDGGIPLAIDTVEQLFQIPINYYAWVGLDGFVKVIDTLGGVTINAIHPIVDDSYPNDMSGSKNPFSYTRVYIPAGPQYMTGATALEYVRSRHADLIGDFGRAQRQEQMLLGIRHKASTLNVLLHLPDLVNELSGFVKSDIGANGLGQLQQMASFARNLNPASVHRLVLSPPRYSSVGTAPDGESVVYPNWATIMPAVQRMFAPISTHSVSHVTVPVKPKPPAPPPSPVHVRSVLGHVVGVSPGSASAPPPTAVTGPSSGRIYFERQGNIWAFTKNTTFQVTHSSNISDPASNGDGHILVFARRWAPAVSDLFSVDLQNQTHRQLTRDRTTDGNVSDNVWAFNPSLSPNGKTLLFSSDRYKLTNPTGQIDLALYKYDMATHQSVQLTMPDLGAGGDADPRFDPANPNLVLYTDYFYRADESVGAQLTLLNLNTDTTYPVTPRSQEDIQPAWQPNGSHVAFVRSTFERTTLYIAPFAGGILHDRLAIPVDTGMVSMPVFSPDGTRLAYFKLVGNDFHLFEVAIRNGRPFGAPTSVLTAPGMDAASSLVWVK
ncbi:MAG TPA: LCP family protein [Chloroflexota bacterium]|nr:LCP family protein [Chloroflexota bacterium]